MQPEYDDYDDSGEDQLGFKPEARKAEELRKKERRKMKEELRQKVGDEMATWTYAVGWL